MSNLRELKAAMPADFVANFKETADSMGMTHRQLAAACQRARLPPAGKPAHG